MASDLRINLRLGTENLGVSRAATEMRQGGEGARHLADGERQAARATSELSTAQRQALATMERMLHAQAAAIAASNRETDQLRRLSLAAQMSAEAYRKMQTAVAAENEAIRAGIALGSAEHRQLEANARAQAAYKESIAKATAEHDRLNKSQRATAEATSSIRPLLIGLAAAFTLVVAGITAVVVKATEFEQLRLQLRTVTGSAESAAAAFDMIKRFAITTPFEVQNITTAFTMLSAVGIAPTERLLRALGDTASAFGRDITDYTQAVIGAATGETEMLKRFGIVAHIQGQQISFTFHGVTTTMKRDTDAIVGYLAKIGETEFAGGMERQSKSAAGALSNLKDAFSNFADQVGQGGATAAIADGLREITDLFNEMAAHASAALGQKLASLIKAAIDLLVWFVKNWRLLRDAIVALMALQVAAWLYSVTLKIIEMGAAAALAELRILGMNAALLLNPYAIAAVAIAGLVVWIRHLIDVSRQQNEQYLEEVARANQDSVALAKLREQYDTVTKSKQRFHGVRAAAAVGETVLATGPGSYGYELAAIQRLYEARRLSARGTADEKRVVDLAREARDRDIDTLRSQTQAFIDNEKAALANRQALILQHNAQYVASLDVLEAARAAAAGHGPTQTVWERTGEGMVAHLVPDQAVVKLRAAEQAAQRLAQAGRTEAIEFQHSKEALALLQVELDKGAKKTKTMADETDKLGQKVADLIEKHELAIKKRKVLAEAEIYGSATVKAATDVLDREATALNEVAALHKMSAEKREILRRKIEELIATEQRWARQQEVNKTLREQTEQSDTAFADGEMKLQEALTGSTEAMRRQEAEAEALKIAKGQGFELDRAYVAQLASEILKRAEYNRSVQLNVQAIERQREAEGRLKDLEAQLADAVAQSTVASRNRAVALEAEKRRLAEGQAASSDRAKAILDEVRAQHEAERSLRAQIAAEEALAETRRRQAGARAALVDWKAQAAAASLYGSEVAGILERYGLLSRATEELAIQEEVLAAIRERGLEFNAQLSDEQNRQLLLQRLAVENEIRGVHEVDTALRAQQAQLELVARAMEPIQEAWRQTGEEIKGVIGDLILGAEVSWKEFMRRLLEMWVRALIEMFARWVVMQRAMAATRLAGAAAGSSGAGGVTGGMSAIGALGGSAGVAGGAGGMFAAPGGAGWGGLFGGSAYGGGAAGAAVGVGAWVAVFAVVYLVVKNWIKTAGTVVAEASIGLGQAGHLAVTNVRGDARRLRQVQDNLMQLVDAVGQFVAGLGGIITGFEGSLSVGRRGQGKKTDWYVRLADGMVEHFGKDQQAAMEFAMIQAVKQSDIAGLSPEVRLAIHNSVARTMDQFQADLAVGLQARNDRLGDAGARYMGIDDRYRAQIEGEQRLGLAIDATVAARERERQAMIYAALGIDMSASEYLASLVSLNRGIAESAVARRAELQLQIEETQRQIADMERRRQQSGREGTAGGPETPGGIRDKDLSEYDAALAHLREVLAAYVDELNKIPEALTQDQISLGIFQTLYRFLEGSQKYEADRVKWAKFMVEIQLQAIKAQIVALGMWDAYAQMWQDAYDAAMAAAGGKAPRGGRGGGQSRAERAQAQRDLREEVAAEGMGETGRAILASQQHFRDLSDRIRAAGFAAAETARLLAEAARQGEAALQSIQDGVDRATQQFINAGTALGGPLLAGFAQLDANAAKLIRDNEELMAAGRISADVFHRVRTEIEAAARRQKESSLATATGQLFLDLYQLLGMDKEAAQLKYDLAVLELQMRRQEIELAMRALGYTEERIRAITGPLDILITKVIEAGPALFGPGGGGGAGGTGGGGEPGTPGGEGQGGHWQWTGFGWKWIPDAGGTGTGSSDVANAQRRIQEILDSVLSPMAREIKAVNAEFDELRKVVGNTTDLEKAHAIALQQVIDQHLQGVRDMLDSMNLSDVSPLKPLERFADIQGRVGTAFATLMGGNAEGLDKFPELIQQLLQEAQTVTPVAGQGFRDIFKSANDMLNRVLEQFGGLGAETGATQQPAPLSIAASSLDPVVTQLQVGHGDSIIELRGIRRATENTRDEVSELRSEIPLVVRVLSAFN